MTWFLKIVRKQNGYLLTGNDNYEKVIEDDETNALLAGQRLLWEVLDYFGANGSKFDEQRINIVIEKNEN